MVPLVVDTQGIQVVLVEELVEEITKVVILEKGLKMSFLLLEVLLADMVMMVEMVKLVAAEAAAEVPAPAVHKQIPMKLVVEAMELVLFLGFLQLFLAELILGPPQQTQECLTEMDCKCGVEAVEAEALTIPMVQQGMVLEQELTLLRNLIVDLEAVEPKVQELHALVGLDLEEFVLLDI